MLNAPNKVSLEEIKRDCVMVSTRWPEGSMDLAVLTRDGADTEYLIGGPALAKVLVRMASVADLPLSRMAIAASRLSELEKCNENASLSGLGHLIICEEEEDLAGTALLALVCQERAQTLSRIGVHLPRD